MPIALIERRPEPERMLLALPQGGRIVRGNIIRYDTWQDAPEIPESFAQKFNSLAERMQKKLRLRWNGWDRFWIVEDFDERDGHWKKFLWLLTDTAPRTGLPLCDRVLEMLAEREMPADRGAWERKFAQEEAAAARAKAAKDEEWKAFKVEAVERTVKDAASWDQAERMAVDKAIEGRELVSGAKGGERGEQYARERGRATDRVHSVGKRRRRR